MSLVRVPIANTIGKSVRFDLNATVGATIGTDLFLPDGSLPTLEELFTAIVNASADITVGGTADQIFFEDISGVIADAQVPESAVTQHQAALTILESQITDGSILARVAGNESIVGDWIFSGLLTIPEAAVTDHQAALSILETQIPNGTLLARVADAETITALWDFSAGITATTYGGILEANLLDKTSPETIVADYTFASLVPRIWFEETDAVADNQLWSIKAAFERFSISAWTDNKVSENQFFQVERTGQVIDSIKLTATAIDIVGALTATSYGGILEANLLDKTAAETISGAYLHTSPVLFQGEVRASSTLSVEIAGVISTAGGWDNQNGCLITAHNTGGPIAGATAGDLTLIPRTSITGRIHFATGSTTPVKRLTIEDDGLRVDGVMKMRERAAAVADTVAYGQLWIKNTTPAQLWFTDDAGTDTQIV